ncbi:Uncharacterised protein [Klebsiella pneumoniae]|uniref:Uncharacterized protein n=1 Tax=Klebsiella pneumoniae TaxID=573 RepID=A0A377VEE9_KLEPN|nr:Uncharacterised protein [Klebsiella pneumoniae]
MSGIVPDIALVLLTQPGEQPSYGPAPSPERPADSDNDPVQPCRSSDFHTTAAPTAWADGAGGNTVVDHLRRRMADHLSSGDGIRLQLNAIETPGLPRFGHNAAFHNMQWMQFDPIHAGRHYLLQRLQTMPLALSWQTDDQMRTDFQPPLSRQARGTLITGEIVSTVNAMQGLVMSSLQPSSSHTSYPC